MQTWSSFTTSDLFMIFMSFFGFVVALIVFKTAFKVNDDKLPGK